MYGLVLSKPKSTYRLDKDIVSLDSMMSRGSGKTKFRSISDVLSGKIKTFAAGEHGLDEHFKVLFSIDSPGGGRLLTCNSDVERWIPPSTDNTQPQSLEESNCDSEKSGSVSTDINASRSVAKLNRLLDIAMVPSAINPIGRKEQRSLLASKPTTVAVQGEC